MTDLVGYAVEFAKPKFNRGGPGSFYIPLEPEIVILIVVASLALPLLLLVIFFRKGRARLANEQRLLATGTPGQARVLGMQHGGAVIKIGVQRSISLLLSLEVHLQGRPPYTAQVQKFVPELNLALFQQGAWLDVRVDPMNPNSLAVAGAASPPNAGMPGGAPPMY